MKKKYPFFKCLLPIDSNKDIIELSKIISDKLSGGIPFVGLEEYIYDEVPAVYIANSILGLEIIIQGFGGEDGYILELGLHPNTIEPDDTEYIEIDITRYVATLLGGTEGLQVRYQDIKSMNYVEITE